MAKFLTYEFSLSFRIVLKPPPGRYFPDKTRRIPGGGARSCFLSKVKQGLPAAKNNFSWFDWLAQACSSLCTDAFHDRTIRSKSNAFFHKTLHFGSLITVLRWKYQSNKSTLIIITCSKVSYVRVILSEGQLLIRTRAGQTGSSLKSITVRIRSCRRIPVIVPKTSLSFICLLLRLSLRDHFVMVIS